MILLTHLIQNDNIVEEKKMSEQKVSLWEKWKVQVAFVAGALVVSSVWGSCSYTPSVPEAEKVEDSAPAAAATTPEVATEVATPAVTEGAAATEVTPAETPAAGQTAATPVVTPAATTVATPAAK